MQIAQRQAASSGKAIPMPITMMEQALYYLKPWQKVAIFLAPK